MLLDSQRYNLASSGVRPPAVSRQHYNDPMDAKRAVAAFFLSQLLAAGAFAQGAATAPGSEFGRASGGDIELMTKHAKPFSGTFSLTQGSSRGYGLSLCGTLVPDRIWFFASAQTSTPR